jgi:hypothetical protein
LNDPGSAPAYSGVENSSNVRAGDPCPQVDDGGRQGIGVVVRVEVWQQLEALVEGGDDIIGCHRLSGAEQGRVRRSLSKAAGDQQEPARLSHRATSVRAGATPLHD